MARQDFDAALTYFESALAATSDPLDQAAILQEIASVLRLKGDPEAALSYAKSSEERASPYGITRVLAAARLTAGNVLADLQEYEAAEAALAEASSLLGDLGYWVEQLQALVGLARTYAESGDPEKARAMFLEVLRFDPPWRIRSQVLNNLGIIAMREDDFAAAERLLSEDRDLCKSEGDRHGEMVAAINLGRLHEQTGRRSEAVDCYQLARRLARALGQNRVSSELDDRLSALRIE